MNQTTIHETPAARREGSVMGATRNKKRLLVAAVTIAGIAGGAVVSNADVFSNRAYENPGATVQDLGVSPEPQWPAVPTTCTTDCDITLHAGAGTVSVADSVNGAATVPFWGYGVGTAAPALAGAEGSIIKVPVNTTLTITLANDLPQHNGNAQPLDLSFPSLNSVVHNVDGTYTVHADKVGTMVFQPGQDAVAPRQIAMGLVGVLIVTPEIPAVPEVPATDTTPVIPGTPAADCPSCAFDSAVAYQDEAVVAMTDLDYEFANDPWGSDLSYFGQPRDEAQDTRWVYHVINGESFPNTKVIDTRAGDNLLLRYVNAGVQDKNMGLLGLRQTLLGRNASAYMDSQSLVAPLVGPGETADVAVAIPSDSVAGQKFSLMDQGRQMNHGSDTGFGGALTFIDVWAGAAPTVDGVAFDTGTATLTATGHPGGANYALSNFETLVTDTAGVPADGDWATATPVAFAPAPLDGADALVSATGITATEGQSVWVRVQQGAVWSVPVSIVAGAAPVVLVAPTVVINSYDQSNGLLLATGSATTPATLTGFETAVSPTNVEPVSGWTAVATDPNSISATVLAAHGAYVWVRVTDSNLLTSAAASFHVPYDIPTVTGAAYAAGTLTAVGSFDPLLNATVQVAVTSGGVPGIADWAAGTGASASAISEVVAAAPLETVWVRITDNSGQVSVAASAVA